MAHVTKKQAYAASRAAWNLALTEGRVVRAHDNMSFTSYPTREAALAAVAVAHEAGLTAVEIVALKPNHAAQ